MNKMDFLTCSCIELSVCTWLCDAMVHVLNSSNKNVQKKNLCMHSRRGGKVASIVMGRARGGKRGWKGAKTSIRIRVFCMGSLTEGLKGL